MNLQMLNSAPPVGSTEPQGILKLLQKNSVVCCACPAIILCVGHCVAP